MNTHRNDDHLRQQITEIGVKRVEALKALATQADRFKSLGLSTITGGDSGEKMLREWEKYGVSVVEFGERETDADLPFARLEAENVRLLFTQGEPGEWEATIRACVAWTKGDAERTARLAAWILAMPGAPQLAGGSASVDTGQWLPLNSLPKDGRMVLVSDGEVVSPVRSYDAALGFSLDVDALFHPTHWMPLPSPPASPSSGEPE